MRSLTLITLSLIFLWTNVNAKAMWEAGDLTYPTGETEVSAFVNTPGDSQLQAVLCTKNSANEYRFTLLLPNKLASDAVIKVHVKTDELDSEEYAEVSGNSLDLQIDSNLLIALPDSTKLSLSFDKDDAKFLGIPEVVEVSMSGADMTLRNVASECTALCIGSGFKCNYPLLSSLLWPQDRYTKITIDDLDNLCTLMTHPGYYKFTNSKACHLALDRFYKKDGIGPLSFIFKLFNDKTSSYQKYVKSWNEVVNLTPSANLNLGVRADDADWYIVLYSLVGHNRIKELPSSYYNIKNLNGDPTTLVYDVDNRYEMELLKYSSVLHRRVRGNVNAVSSVEKALKQWSDFYRELCASLPNIQQAQAIRPIVYRQMLMRVWRLAGRPQGIRLLSENAFKQGSGGKTLTHEPLEAQCSFFEGTNGEQFYFASENCIKGIDDYMRTSPLNTNLYKKVLDKWDTFAKQWQDSKFFNDGIDDAVGEHPRGNLGVTVLSLFKIYGFGDYFLLRECISSRDNDICGYEVHKAYNTYTKEFNYRLDSITSVNEDDGAELNRLNNLWLDYYHALSRYLKDLISKGLIDTWRAEFVKGVAAVVQTNALLNFPYDKEQLPDISLNDDEDDSQALYQDDSDKKMSIEQDRYDDESDMKSVDPDEDIDDDIIVPD